MPRNRDTTAAPARPASRSTGSRRATTSATDAKATGRSAASRGTTTRANDASPQDPSGARPGRLRQILQTYRFTQKADRTTLPFMLLALVVPIVIAEAVLWPLGHPLYGLFLGIAFGVLAAMFVLARKAEAAAYGQIADQKGAALAAMQSIRRGWNVEDEPCQVDPRSQDMVFRASGRAGVALVVEDSNGRVMKLLRKEAQRLDKVLPNVPVHQVIVGDGEGEVRLSKLASHLQRMRPTLTRDEAALVAKRLRAMPGPIRNAVPKGVDPMRARPDRRAMRGR